MSDGFYRAFEEKHRGSRELIKSRLRAYFPFVEPLAQLDQGAKTIDLGCGRGEWLELMSELGFKSHGVDLDQGMLSGCVELGLSVAQGDAIDFLAALPSQSQLIVSAFHVVEHISFEQLQRVVSEALRVLKPGGLLIMETPNPENIIVSTCNFYLDPTHQRPIPPQLLSFLPEYVGFARVKTIRLQESKSLLQSASLTLQDVLGGVSPDYAVIAQKTAAAELLQKTDSAFEDEYGLSLDTLATRYTAQIETKTHQAQAKAVLALAQAQQAEVKAGQAAAQALQLQQALHAMLASRSWRITAPLRWCGLQARRLREQGLWTRTQARIKKIARPFVRRCITFVDAHPALRKWAVVPARRAGDDPIAAATSHASRSNQPSDPPQLTPRARAIDAELKANIENKRDAR
jgi:O-antigen chain-terminating methyltransferase